MHTKECSMSFEPLATTRGARCGRVLVTALVASLAAGSLAGCAGNDGFAFFKNTKSYSQDDLANQATISLNPQNTHGAYTSEWYQGEASESNLPNRWLSEAQLSVSENEARRAAAQAGLAINAADRFERLAAENAAYERAASRRDVSGFRADSLGQVYDAKLDELVSQTEATRINNTAGARRGLAEVDITTLEWQQQFERMYAEADKAWNAAQGEHVKMLAERERVESAGNAKIDQMDRVADLTEKRAAERVAQLRAEARAIQIQSQAQVDALDRSISTTGEQFDARSDRWRELASAAEKAADARVSELRSQAKAVSEQDAEGKYELDKLTAQLEYDRKLAEAEQMTMAAEALAQQTKASVDRLRAESDKDLALSQTEYETEIAAIDRFVEHGESEIAFQRAEAHRIEREARAEFIKAEAAARANAIRETSRHQQQLSEAERELIAAEAKAEAARIQKDLYQQLAKQRAAGRVTLPNKTDQPDPAARNGDANPEMANASQKPELLHPEHVANFRASLAEAASIRKQQDATEKAVFATAQERTTQANAWWDQRVARHESSLVQANSLERKGAADVEELFFQADAVVSAAEAERSRAVASAEAFRRETLAKIVGLHAEADAIARTAEAEVTEYLARADNASFTGNSEVSHLRVTRDSSGVRGEAEAERLLAEAQAFERTQLAVVTQMRQEIATAEDVLDAELAKLDRTADAFIAIAEATFNEHTSTADTFAAVSQAKVAQLAASNEANEQIAEGEVQYLAALQKATELAAEANVQRMVADADYEFGTYQAADMINRARIVAESRMAEAEAEAQFHIADADDRAVRARFDSRVVQTSSERNRAYAMRYLHQQREYAAWAQAAAVAASYADISAQALAQLDQRAQAFRLIAQENWDERLASMPAFPAPGNGQDLYFKALNDLSTPNGTIDSPAFATELINPDE
jgi:hypothetical protein